MDQLTSLAISARDGNKLALGSFIHQTQADVWRLCNRLGPPNSADDLTQDVYLRLMKALPAFRGESSARTWLLAIARNTATDALRSHLRRERLIQLVKRRETVADIDSMVEVDSVIEVLEPAQREAFVLTQLLGLSYQEAAQVCNCAVGTIRSRVARSRSRLIVELETHDGSRLASSQLQAD